MDSVDLTDVDDVESKVARWHDIRVEVPYGRLLVVRTRGGYFLHPMVNRAGAIVPWWEQEEKWTDGRFDYRDVTHWIRLA